MCRCCWKTISTLLCWDMSRSFPGEVAGLTAGIYFPGRFGPGMGLALGRSPWPGRQGFVGSSTTCMVWTSGNGMDHGNPAAVEETAARYLRAVCVMAGPERVVLYGDIFRLGSAEAIRQKVEKDLLQCVWTAIGGSPGHGARLQRRDESAGFASAEAHPFWNSLGGRITCLPRCS